MAAPARVILEEATECVEYDGTFVPVYGELAKALKSITRKRVRLPRRLKHEVGYPDSIQMLLDGKVVPVAVRGAKRK